MPTGAGRGLDKVALTGSAKVIVADMSMKQPPAAAEINASGAAKAFAVNIAKQDEEVKAMMDYQAGLFGTLDVIVNAGINNAMLLHGCGAVGSGHCG